MLPAGAIGLTLHDGVRNPALGLLGLVVCCIAAVASVRVGVALAAARRSPSCSRIACARVARRQHRPAAAGNPLMLMFLLQCLVVVSGLAAGAPDRARASRTTCTRPPTRERALAALLRLAADLVLGTGPRLPLHPRSPIRAA